MSRSLTHWVEYIDSAEVGADITLAEVELRKPRNLFVCVSEESEDGELCDQLFIMNR